MPKHYTQKLTHLEILALFDCGKYIADLETGKVLSGRTFCELYVYAGNKEGYLFTRLYCAPKFRTIPVSHIIWIVGTRSAIPENFQIHHKDTDKLNNAFLNLYALHKVDHKKLHTGKLLEVPNDSNW